MLLKVIVVTVIKHWLHSIKIVVKRWKILLLLELLIEVKQLFQLYTKGSLLLSQEEEMF